MERLGRLKVPINLVLGVPMLCVRNRISVVLSVVVSCFTSSGVAADPLPVYVFERAPYSVYQADSSVQGLVATPAAEAFNGAGVSFVWKPLAVHRILDRIKSDAEPACAVGWFKTPERSAFARYTLPVYRDKPMVVLAREDNKSVNTSGSLAELFSNAELNFLAKVGFSYGGEIDDVISNGQARRKNTTDSTQVMVSRILEGREDFMLMSPEELDLLMANLGSSSTELTQVQFPEMPEGNYRYILCSMSVSEKLLAQLNTEIKEMVK